MYLYLDPICAKAGKGILKGICMIVKGYMICDVYINIIVLAVHV